jgi:hypothetical protein
MDFIASTSPQYEMDESINEIKTIDLQWSIPMFFDYKFILHRFPKPFNKNILSIQFKLSSELPTNTRLYISLYADSIQLTTPKQFKRGHPQEILQFKFVPSQLTPIHQFQLVAHMEHTGALNEPSHTNTADELIHLCAEFNVKYAVFKSPEKIEDMCIHHNDDMRDLKVKHGRIYFMKRFY